MCKLRDLLSPALRARLDEQLAILVRLSARVRVRGWALVGLRLRLRVRVRAEARRAAGHPG